MSDYKSMYLSLFNFITDAVEILKSAQQRAEEAYIGGAGGEGIKIVKLPPETKKAAK